MSVLVPGGFDERRVEDLLFDRRVDGQGMTNALGQPLLLRPALGRRK